MTNTSGGAAARAERRQRRGAVRVDHRHRRRGARASRAAVRDRVRAREDRASSRRARASRRRRRCSGARPASPSSGPAAIASTSRCRGRRRACRWACRAASTCSSTTRRATADNHAADLVMHEDVGKWVALGGDAYHLAEACRRLQALEPDDGAGARPRAPAPAIAPPARACSTASPISCRIATSWRSSIPGCRRTPARTRGRHAGARRRQPQTCAGARSAPRRRAANRTQAVARGHELRPGSAAGDASMGRRPCPSTSRRSTRA